ncbi:TIGR03943 family protein [Paenibacillus sp. MSJ-34]|uniref:TIGR03943 family putative permease subunit n=1 Tax=Paenibacillus sp. MSJ-34 TaxID=2841529 RepID=UPI001C121D21|nr:TIGR03943 family protein [Paenibacillus sp. MSJ-34]MBU5441741.1 TIGR03943 family protein [Paenibacillus sp. MSJ-34]
MFLFPLLLGFGLPDALLDSTLASKRGVNLSKGEMQRSGQSIVQTNSLSERMRQQVTLTIEEPAKPNGTSGLGVQDSMSSSPLADGAAWDEKLKEMFVADEFYEDFAKLGMKLYKQDIISVPEEGFIETITAIDIFKDLFVGKTAELSGFVYRDESMKRNQFAVTRFEVQCCSADASAFGIMVELDEAPKYKTDDWVKVTGIIGKSKYEDNDIVKLEATKIEPIPALASPYVYPDYQFLFKP